MSTDLLTRINDRLLAWTCDAEPSDGYEDHLLAEDDHGDWLVPRGRDGDDVPYWQGMWCWWKPSHWPVYVRSRRRNTYVMVERWPS